MKIFICSLIMFFSLSFPIWGENIDIIYQNNLFSEDRSFHLPKSQDTNNSANVEKTQSEIERKINLLGVIIIGKVKKAIVRLSPSFMSIKERGKNVLTVEVGDKINSFLIKEIGDGNLTLAQGGRVYTIPLTKAPVKPLPIEKTHKISTPHPKISEKKPREIQRLIKEKKKN
ncbi:MAG: hypothetical protein J7J46_08180 [Candidatus Desulfofervidus sp.]|nr:hypothetical protein [Candidatus Desulfofervidus sp.]